MYNTLHISLRDSLLIRKLLQYIKLYENELGPGLFTDLNSDEVSRFEVVGGAAAPVHYVLVLALAAQLAVPVSHAQVVVH